MKKITALVLALTLALSLTACGGSSDTGADSTPNDTTDTSASSAPSMRAEDLAGGWVDDDGNTLVIDTEDGTYGYRTYYGRVGRGDYTEDAGKPMLDYDNFNYDLLSVDGGLTLRQNGSSDPRGAGRRALWPGRERAVRVAHRRAGRRVAGRSGGNPGH
ncbi:MAG: hypothetical protein V8S71_08925 [Oscillospiraceae bacterium]